MRTRTLLITTAALVAAQGTIQDLPKSPIALCRKAFLTSHIDFLKSNDCSDSNLQPCPKLCGSANRDRFIAAIAEYAAESEECRAVSPAEVEVERKALTTDITDACAASPPSEIPSQTQPIVHPTDFHVNLITTTLPPPPPKKTETPDSKNQLAIGLGVTLGAVVFIIIATVLFFLRRRRHRRRKQAHQEESPTAEEAKTHRLTHLEGKPNLVQVHASPRVGATRAPPNSLKAMDSVRVPPSLGTKGSVRTPPVRPARGAMRESLVVDGDVFEIGGGTPVIQQETQAERRGSVGSQVIGVGGDERDGDGRDERGGRRDGGGDVVW
ncbi:hypothetical protein BJ508DRAFT_69129 [Ascobolus immersus RN42]|uniref:Extracellular membrane protein CFEM domain-containing protein n=1 Tax=Ascobolus immersus RN42 TaxID=1160509 RepID=A0A3N4HEL1_ASCIM|nr:hypothetical protein BJ508DRAFT_69129 [Ascobolus immersus RN42]